MHDFEFAEEYYKTRKGLNDSLRVHVLIDKDWIEKRNQSTESRY